MKNYAANFSKRSCSLFRYMSLLIILYIKNNFFSCFQKNGQKNGQKKWKKTEFKDLSMKPNASSFVIFNFNEMRPLFRLSRCFFIGVIQEFWKFCETSQFKHGNIWIYGKNFREKKVNDLLNLEQRQILCWSKKANIPFELP